MKEHFRKYNDILNQIRELEYKIITLKERLYSISGVRFDDMPKAYGVGNDIVYRIQEIEDLIKEKNVLLEVKKELYDKHLKEIEQLSDERYRYVLRCYYLQKMTLKNISSLYGLTINHVQKIKGKAVEEFMRIISKNECK